MDPKFWKAAVGLGVPGLALAVFYQLYQKLDWPLAKIPPDKMFLLVLVFMVIVAVVVLFALFLYRPQAPKQIPAANGISVSVPKNWKFKAIVETLAGQRLVEFHGFTDKELAAAVQSRDFVAPNDIEILRQVQKLTDGKVRIYDVEKSASGTYILRVNTH